MKPFHLRIILPGILFNCSCLLNAQDKSFSELQGKYLGQNPPVDTPIVFAKDIISTPLYEHSAPAFSPDGKTVLWTVLEREKPARLLEMTMMNGVWGQPHAPAFADSSHDDFYPFFSPDGKILFFSSRRPLPSGSPVGDMRLWMVARRPVGWGKAKPLDSAVSKGFEYAHSVSAKGNLFFSAREIMNGKPSWKIYYSKLAGKGYTAPKALDSTINNGAYIDGPFISPDEQYLIFESDREGGMGSMDLYICFKNEDGKWQLPKNMGAKVNSPFAERFAGVSPDGKYLFFGSNRGGDLPDIYWIGACVIDDLMKTGS